DAGGVRGDSAKLRRAAAEGDAVLGARRKGDHAELVLHPVADVADQHRGIDGVIEPRDLLDARGHAVSAVDAEEDFLRAVKTELADDEAAVARRGVPG